MSADGRTSPGAEIYLMNSVVVLRLLRLDLSIDEFHMPIDPRGSGTESEAKIRAFGSAIKTIAVTKRRY
eukprot:scaffold121976_cov41-Prasinocladus_malaysianus.AAC.1